MTHCHQKGSSMVVQDRTIASLVFVLCALAATVLVIFHLHISHVSLEQMQVFELFFSCRKFQTRIQHKNAHVGFRFSSLVFD